MEVVGSLGLKIFKRRGHSRVAYSFIIKPIREWHTFLVAGDELGVDLISHLAWLEPEIRHCATVWSNVKRPVCKSRCESRLIVDLEHG